MVRRRCWTVAEYGRWAKETSWWKYAPLALSWQNSFPFGRHERARRGRRAKEVFSPAVAALHSEPAGLLDRHGSMRRIPLSRPRTSRAGARGTFDPAQYVKRHVKTNKNDFLDAEAIAEAVGGLGCASSRSRVMINWTSSHGIEYARALGNARHGCGQSDAWIITRARYHCAEGEVPFRSGLAYDSERQRCKAVGSSTVAG